MIYVEDLSKGFFEQCCPIPNLATRVKIAASQCNDSRRRCITVRLDGKHFR